MREAITKYSCENCQRTVYAKQIPVGWALVSLEIPNRKFFSEADLCESCLDAFITTLSKRKRIEGGRYREKELPIYNPPHPDNAGINPLLYACKKTTIDPDAEPVKH